MAFPSSKKKGKGLLSSGDVGLFVLGKACGIYHPNTSLSVCMIACSFMQLLNIPNSETRSTHIGSTICMHKNVTRIIVISVIGKEGFQYIKLLKCHTNIYSRHTLFILSQTTMLYLST